MATRIAEFQREFNTLLKKYKAVLEACDEMSGWVNITVDIPNEFDEEGNIIFDGVYDYRLGSHVDGD